MTPHKIIHISDLHFDTQREGILNVLINDINAQLSDIIVVSGDLTQRAHTYQFKQALDFFSRLNNKSILCVPGNHDISMYNPLERFLYPFYKYNKWIRSYSLEYWQDDKLVVLGVNSVAPFRSIGGDINDKEFDKIQTFFSNYRNKDVIKIIIMHHNLIRSVRHKNMLHAEKILSFFASLDINLILSGHIHVAYIEQLKRNYLSHNMYVITAGTAISTRTIQANSYNIIELSHNTFQLTVRSFKDGFFATTSINQYKL